MDKPLGSALSRNCGIVAVTDTETNEVVVANAGDDIRPKITCHRLDENDRSIVVALDGLYDQLSNAEAMDIVAHGSVVHGQPEQAGLLMSQDKNVATHLIHLAFSAN
ncbi:hypothetical protein BX070DRAFT_250263 [Coemansia spiralis]|nr:hypothetical protein BX070DRAFT_250263 [Coemansia spiralis]